MANMYIIFGDFTRQISLAHHIIIINLLVYWYFTYSTLVYLKLCLSEVVYSIPTCLSKVVYIYLLVYLRLFTVYLLVYLRLFTVYLLVYLKYISS